MGPIVLKKLTLILFFVFGAVGIAEARLTVTDKLSTYRRASSQDRIDLATRLGKSFSSLAPGLNRDYFIKCLEETVNIGDPRDLELDEAVRLCVAAHRAPGEE
ncbi:MULTISPECIES: hypothetical protein [Methylobacterium]|uniref:Secreted protein n=1 Tax=Methylobacterium thuringiense TaxID=1003091 RepID=A0ABQ4TIS9_9HYPH|nr:MULTISPECIES: hypothetical protein [Methylobacterium]GJE55289.1 hypothetical protein EKPJFOCH_1779 [Methylobacterium thuringiense]